MSLLLRSDDTVVPSPLPQGAGYAVVVAVGLIFALGMIGITRLLKKTLNEDNANVETFMVANRSVGTGLVASAVVSSWLWSTALLSCVLVTYLYGVSGGFWYGAGCTPYDLPLYAAVGTVAHLVFTFLAVVNNLFNTINMILGAAAVITFLTGIHIMASTFLLPVGVVLYTLVGGIKATFLTDYIHTFVIAILCCYLTTKTLTHHDVGSIDGLYDLVVKAQPSYEVDGNYQGSLLTMNSQQGIFFAIILLVSNFGAVIMDTSYFIKAFAASPKAVVPGYVVGGFAYFSIPWSLGTIMGLAALGLESSPIFPTYPRTMTSLEVTNGLVLPYVAVAVAGKGGAVAVLLMTFMAITSTLSAQVIAVSSIFTFDLYRTYVNKNAGNKDVIRWSHLGVILFAAISAGLTAAFNYGGINMGWTLYMIGVVTCPGIFPLILTILWNKQSALAAVVSAIAGLGTGLGVWLGTAQALFGEVTVDSTGQTLPCMYGTVASALSPLLYTVILSLIWPDNYDWARFTDEKLLLDSDTSAEESEREAPIRQSNKGGVLSEASEAVYDQTDLRWQRYALLWSLFSFFGIWVLWPLPMYGAKYIFSKVVSGYRKNAHTVTSTEVPPQK
ncbi:urea active transporter [Trichoderma harzianum]|uniref:Urea active transporter n=1 Tax=Trichoderma harzianum TaxID=5544 RepID=A0A0F9WZ41_TRIHA|nr:urea active transporter [Trichoderma harzianum]